MDNVKITLEDLKKFSEIYEQIMLRANELIVLQAKIKGLNPRYYYIDYITEFTNEYIEFCVEGEDEYVKFSLEDFISEDYYNLFKKQYEEMLEQQRIREEEKERQRKISLEKSERATLRRLMKKYPDEVK